MVGRRDSGRERGERGERGLDVLYPTPYPTLPYPVLLPTLPYPTLAVREVGRRRERVDRRRGVGLDRTFPTPRLLYSTGYDVFNSGTGQVVLFPPGLPCKIRLIFCLV